MKNKLIMTACLMLVSLLAFTQDSKKLDDKYGFNKFGLGSFIDDIKKVAKISEVKSKEKDMTRYNVKDIDSYKLFGYNLGGIHLIFYKGELLEIQVSLPNYDHSQKDRYELISKDIFLQMEKEYGDFTERTLTTKDQLNNISNSAEIVGKDVTLLLTVFNSTTRNFVTSYRGMIFTFISARVYRLSESERGNTTGL